MPYTPDPINVTEPTDSQPASTSAAEFRALKAYIAGINAAGKVAKAGDTMTGTLGFSSALATLEAVRIAKAGGYISGFNDASTVRYGYLQFNAASTRLAGENGAVVRLEAGGAYVDFDGANLLPNGDANVNLGTALRRFANIRATSANVSGTVNATAFVGDGSGLTNVPGTGGSVSQASVIAALGYTPYNSANPNGYISGISGGNVVAALGYTPYNANNPSGYISGISKISVDAALGFTTGTNATGTRTVSPSAPSGGVDGDIWYQY